MSELPKPEEAPQRELVGYDKEGKELVSAVPPDADVAVAEEKLREAGGRLTRVLFTGPKRARPASVSAEEFARFNELLGSAVRRGVPMPEGIRRLALAFGGRRFRKSLESIREALARGVPLREAFAPERSGFPALYGSMMEAGAASGRLSATLLALSRNIRTDAAFRRGIVEACIYPVFLVCVCCGVLTAFAAHILPQFEETASQIGVTMPWFTRLISTDDAGQVVLVLVAWLLIVVLALILGGVEPVIRRLPYFRAFYEAALWSSAADMLALLLRAEVPAPAALRLVGPATGSRWLRASLDRLAEAAEKGRPLSVAGREDPAVPSRFNYALDVGERRGDPAAAMSDLAERYRYEAGRRSQLLVRYLPPALAVILGVLVFLMIIAVLGPYFRFWGGIW